MRWKNCFSVEIVVVLFARAAWLCAIVFSMDTFGIIFALPIAVVISVFYPRFIVKLFGRNRIFPSVLCILSCIVVVAVCIEIGVIAKYGIVVVHDSSHSLLDKLQGWNSLLGPASITNLAIWFLLQKKLPHHLVKLISGCICFAAIMLMGLSNLFYDDAAHYRTDKEGTYRIQE